MRRLLQLTFDFFGSAPPATPAEPDPKKPPHRNRKTRDAMETIVADEPVQRLDKILAPASFRNPRANREAVLGDAVVAYEFRRGRRRNIGFLVGPEGLTVSAPKWVPLYEVDAALHDKAGWIVRKLGDANERRQRAESARIEWRDGALFPFLGEQVIVVLDPRHAFDEVGAVLNSAADALPGVPRLTLHVGLAQNAKTDQVRDAVQ